MPITLWAPLDVVLRRHERRRRAGQVGVGAERSWRAIAEQLDHLGILVDASGTIEETLTLIDEELDGSAR
jgi:hypothetical protein